MYELQNGVNVHHEAPVTWHPQGALVGTCH